LLFITVSRQTGSLGKEITERLAEMLNLPILTRELVMSKYLPRIATKHELHMMSESPSFFLTPAQDGTPFALHIERGMREYIARRPAVILGLGGQVIFAGHPNALHIKIIASPEVRLQRIMQQYSLESKDAERFLELTDRKHKKYISTLYNRDWSDPTLYHLIVNTDFIGIEEAAAFLCNMARNRETLQSKQQVVAEVEGKRSAVFKHPSEEEFARILDMNHIEWQYEPRTFPIKTDAEGNITQAFSPDFYLPKFDTFIELTTMNQKYVAEKKKKVQLLRKLYPGTNINIVFKKDFNTLVKRFTRKEDSEE